MKNKISIIILLTGLLLSCSRTQLPERIAPGESIPPFRVYTLQGTPLSDENFIGKPGLIVFFSTTCPDCHRQLPEVESAWQAFEEENATFLAIAREEDAKSVEDFWKRAGYTIPVAAPGNRDVYNLFDKGHGSGVPLMVFTDKGGTVTATSDDKYILNDAEIADKLLNNK